MTPQKPQAILRSTRFPSLTRKVFYDPLAIHLLDPEPDDEERFVAVGMDSTGRILVVVYTLRGYEVRLISARRATLQEVKEYEA